MIRMHSPLLSTVIFVIGLLSGCGTMVSSQVDIEPLPADNQHVVYERGIPLIQNVGKNTTVVVAPTQTPRRYPYQNSFWVSVSNNSPETSFLFAIKDVSVEYNDTTSKVLSYAEAKNEAYTAMQDQQMMAALAYTAQSWNAQLASNSSVRSTSTPGTSYQVYDPAKTQQLNMQAGEQLKSNQMEVASAYQSRVGALEDYVRRDTIVPSETFGGYFMFRVPNFQSGKANNLTIKVTAGNEVHEFRFREFNLGLNPSQIDPAASVDDQKNATQDTSNGIFLKGRKLWGI
jgi:hypothetical protein